MNLDNSIRDISVGIGGPVGGLFIANMSADPFIANLSVTLGALAALSVIIKNIVDIWKNNQK
jgi:hypothetical protein